MAFLEIIGLIVVLYYLFYLVVPIFLDCDVQLAFKEKYGKPVESLRGKIVWITGASSGIGENLAYALANVGCKLILSARREAELLRVKQKCLADNKALTEDDVEVLVLDVSDFELHEKALKHVINKFGKLDILVNNAGRSQRANWEEINLEVDRQMFDLNVFGAVVLSRLVFAHFLEKGEGHIAVNSSLAGIMGVPFSATYTATKHALHGYFECLRTETMDKNIQITILCPGPVQTNFLPESFTGKIGQKFGKQADSTKGKVSGERCGKLFAVAIANRLHEAWVALPPALQLTYLNVYYPNLSKLVMTYLGPRYLLRLRDTKDTMKPQ